MGEAKVTINLPLYMEVMSRLPGVTKEDVEEARGVLGLAYNGVPGELTFYRGPEKRGRAHLCQEVLARLQLYVRRQTSSRTDP